MDNRKICRLCLKLIYESNFVAVGETTKHMLSALCLNLNLNITKDPVACADCVIALQTCCDFKWPYIRARKNLIPSIYCADDTSNLLDVCLKQNETVTLNVSKICQKVCRICYRGANGCFTDLYETMESMSIVETLSTHIPEVTLMKTEDFITCEPCLNILKHFNNFILNCKDVEDTIQKYVEFERTDAGDSNIDEANRSLCGVLSAVVKSERTIEDLGEDSLIKCGRNPNNIQEVSNYKVLNTTVKTEPKMDYFPDEENLDMHIESEEIFIKSEDSDSDRNHTSEESEENEIQKYKCKLCPYVGKQERYFNSHMLRHNRVYITIVCSEEDGTLMYKCNLCSFEATMQKFINRHLLHHKDPPGPTAHKCENKRSMKPHLRMRRNFPQTGKKCSVKLRKRPPALSNKSKPPKALTCDLCLGTGQLETFT